MASLTPEREQKLIELACELVARVREIDPERNGMRSATIGATC